MTARTSPRGLYGIVVATLLALSLVLSTANALAATVDQSDGAARSDTGRLGREFFHGRGLLFGTTWE